MNSYGKGGDKGVGVNIMCNLDVAVCVWGGGGGFTKSYMIWMGEGTKSATHMSYFTFPIGKS